MDRLVVHVAKHSTGALNSQLQEDNNNQQSSGGSTPVKNEAKINVAPLQTLQNPVLVKSEHETPYLTPTFDAYNHFSNFPANLATQFALMSQQQSMQNAFMPQGLYQNAGIPTQLMFQHSQLMQSPLLAPQHGYQADNMTSPLAAMAANLNKRALSPHHEISPRAEEGQDTELDEDTEGRAGAGRLSPIQVGTRSLLLSWLLSELSRFNEDCQYQHCGYREHQTHFHCQRQDCGYSFCDKTRFVQHTARHERLDTLMGGDFQQYRANVACGSPTVPTLPIWVSKKSPLPKRFYVFIF
jgi:hypothetical protein